MIRLEIVSVRQMNKDTVDRFFNSDFGIAEHIQKNFVDTGKLISTTIGISSDYSTQTKTLLFKDIEAYMDFVSDDVLQYQEILQIRYNTWHSIIVNKSVT